eukprot:TRINITY_DN3116_c0_g2_i5.p1 TRINITY_DN3116_c0_g2~~TRINITY_DN3116_c0_g2_i5.p1  ORF type:complete len:337 (-),score=76.24 TRINITY_DN3116_c0_g2_i5:291-1301(-)
MFPENEIVLRKIDTYIQDFESSYVLVRGFEDDAREKISKLVETAWEQLLCANIFFRKMQDNPKQLRDISLIIESYVMERLHKMIFHGLKELRVQEDEIFYQLISSHRRGQTTHSYFGVRPDFSDFFFGKPASVLSQLDSCGTPLQMLFVFMNCMELLLSEGERVQKGKKGGGGGGGGGDTVITTDDMIPILGYVITLSDYRFYETTLYYVENFIFTDISTTKFGFNLTSFKASIMFLKEKEKEMLQKLDAGFKATKRTSSIPILLREKSLPSVDRTIVVGTNLPNKSMEITGMYEPGFQSPAVERKLFQKPPSVIKVESEPASGDDFLKYLKSLGS